MTKSKLLLKLIDEDHPDKVLCTNCGYISEMEEWDKEDRCSECGHSKYGTTDLDAKVRSSQKETEDKL